ncbi:hypothetical protein FOB63_001244 [Clavispora lusitaniae]|uniref:Uncharacterized protein n=1 Tax=Clavispora lusitaniae (strain ATCC 42720) TaxID=306902 RepID=C4Y1V2_CLAL4|nr:uncharacterized protein CLUG_02184 [Clavispora lusitaniae ATCC 42720]EEQ38061.1 predicted protein [Clavispora lusitaniae ATCC 42720]KAF5211648.1 hypothetical protein E0198_001188 [Clavispora lusitaniae]KAF7583026.1 hypothetical protein FOB63_001244 [Clavispora lusitaniae]
MSHRESQEGLLELEDFQNAPKCPPYSEDESLMPLEVRFKIGDTSKFKTSSDRILFFFNENLSVEEAGEKAFKDTFGSIPKEIHASIESRSSSPSAIANANSKIKHLFKKNETLAVSDNLKAYQRRNNCNTLLIMSLMVSLVALLIGLVFIILAAVD